MSHIPDTTSKFEEDYFGRIKEPKVINGYYKELLSDADKRDLMGMEYVRKAIEGFFDNLDVYEEINEYMDTEEYTVANMRGELLSCDDEDFECQSNNVKFLQTFKEAILDWVDGEINNATVSLIDSMNADEHEANYDKVASEEGCPKWSEL